MAPQTQTLFSIPSEVQNRIIRMLDPVSLISLSQTNQYLRSIINPNKRELAERLLALEIEPQYGTSRICFADRQGVTLPNWSLKAWSEHLWACTGCLRLLPHIYFDNCSLLRHEYRKPSPGSPGAQLTSSWLPSLHGKEWGKGSRLTGPEQENGEAPNEVERGSKRWNRQCNECRYQAKILAPPSNQNGVARRVPVQRSRLVGFTSRLHRWFPQLVQTLESKPPPHVDRTFDVYSLKIKLEPWTMYMVRCPQCERWQELREFRLAEAQPSWDPNRCVSSNARCNACFAQEHGRQALAEAMLPHLQRAVRQHRAEWDVRLTLSARVIKQVVSSLRGWESEFKEPLLAQLRSVNEMRRGGLLTQEGITQIDQYRHEFKRLWDAAKNGDWVWVAAIEMNHEFMVWYSCFAQCVAQWRWLVACEQEIERNPGLLAEWALGRDGALFF